jgi:hypothetical protein
MDFIVTAANLLLDAGQEGQTIEFNTNSKALGARVFFT